jgi:hypothetical protein
MSINTKLLNIDCDGAVLLANPNSTVTSQIALIKGNEYVLEANCYASAYSNVFASFDTGNTWELYIGRQYESNASPVVIV